MKITITLTDIEMEVGAHEGVRRRLVNLKRKSQPLRGGFKKSFNGSKEPEPWKSDIEGALAEVAVMRVTNRRWSGISKPGVDVGKNGGVRHTEYDSGHLIVFADDADDRIMVLVTGTPPVLTVHGWIRAADAKRAEYRRQGRPDTEFWVPQECLREFAKEQKAS